MSHTDSQPTPIAEHLKRLMLLRNVLACALVATVGAAASLLSVDLRWGAMAGVLLLLPTANLLAHLRLRHAAEIRDGELFAHLLIDVAVLSALLYLSAGSTNPFVSLYLLPLVIAATTLPPPYAWGMAAVTASCYGLLFFFNLPLAGMHSGHDEGGFHLHLVGMWVNFVLSAGFIAFFVARMAQAIRSRDAELARQEENALRNERIVALGTLAAGAAHELGTPLSTMAVILGEMTRDHADEPELARDLTTLRQQVDACKQTVTRMVAAAGQARAEGGGALAVDEFVRETLERWRLLRPSVTLAERLSGPAPAPSILTEQTLRQAIVSLLDNAADASPHSVELDCSWGGDRLRLEIRDRGPGLSGEAERRAGDGFFSTKPQGEGNGIGLLLARATLERLGGQLRLERRGGGGVCALLELPLGGLAAGERV
jgi:two-component system sensor histidine kinase RegB